MYGTVNSGNFVRFQTLIGFFLKKSFWYGGSFFFSVGVQNGGLGSGSLAKFSKVLTKSEHFLIQKGTENLIHSNVFLQKCISIQISPVKSSSP